MSLLADKDGEAFPPASLDKRGKKVSDQNYYIRVDKRHIAKLNGDLALAVWYSTLRDYARRIKPDELGFTRVSSSIFEQDFGYCRMRVWRLNKKLEDAGFIIVDKTPRGGRRYIGFKFIK